MFGSKRCCAWLSTELFGVILLWKTFYLNENILEGKNESFRNFASPLLSYFITSIPV